MLPKVELWSGDKSGCRGDNFLISTTWGLGCWDKQSVTLICIFAVDAITEIMPILSEDEIYRSSSQFRLWSFTPESLAQIRAQTNANASNAVKAAIAHKYESNATNGSDDITKPEMNVDCLTVEEELKLIGHYCVKTMELSDFCSFPTNVKVAVDSRLDVLIY